jgi:hypothetical protein
MEIILKRTLRGFEPDDEHAGDYLRRVPLGSRVMCEVRRPRNLKQHRRFRALLNIVWAASGHWETPEELHDEIKFRTGWVDRQRIVDSKTGEVLGEITKPRSTSFDAMSQDEFDQYMAAAIKVICEHLVPGIEDTVLREEVLHAVA